MSDEVQFVEPELPSTPETQVEENSSDEDSQSEDNAKDHEAESIESVEDDEDKDITDLPITNTDEDDIEVDELSPEQKKINKILKRRLASEKVKQQRIEVERDQARAQLMQMQQQQMPANNFNERAPTREDFESEEHFIAASVDHQLQRKMLEAQYSQQQEKIMKEREALANTLEKVTAKGVGKYEDFDEQTRPLFEQSFPANSAMFKAIIKSEFSDDLLYHFGKYSHKTKEIARQEPEDAIKKVYELEAKFRAAKVGKKVSANSFSPPSKLKSQPGSAVEPNLQDLEKMPQKKFEEHLKRIQEKSRKIW